MAVKQEYIDLLVKIPEFSVSHVSAQKLGMMSAFWLRWCVPRRTTPAGVVGGLRGITIARPGAYANCPMACSSAIISLPLSVSYQLYRRRP